MRRRQKDIWDQPWVMIAVVVGIVAVVGIALFGFFGGSGSPSGISPSAASVTTAPAGSSTGAPAATTTNTALSASSTSVVTIRTTAPVSVPQEGAFVKVSYLGGYSGTYGVNGAVEKVRGSGEQVYAVSATSGTLQATFQKQDGSPRHDLIVEIWKGGKAITSQKNSSAYGIVSVSSSV